MRIENTLLFAPGRLAAQIKTMLAMALVIASGAVYAGPVDLSSWTATAGGTWNVQTGNDSVLQTDNGNPTFFYDAGSNAQGQSLSGKVKVTTGNDDDFIGFALGFDSGDINSTSADYILVDWKQGNQSLGGNYGAKGLAISHVSDSTNTSGFYEYWSHTGGVSEIARGATLGSTGWADNVEYVFDLQFTASMIEVSVNGTLELSISAADAGLTSFDDGSFAFYNFSQSHVLYSAVEEDVTTLPDGGSTVFFIGLALLALGRRQLALR